MNIRPSDGTEKLIVNLAPSLSLTDDQTAVLLKGLSFVPAPKNKKTQRGELLRGLQKYHRRLKLEAFFERKRNRKEKKPFTGGSDWTPPLSSLPQQITEIVEADLKAFKHLHWERNEIPNLTTSEERALSSLKKNKKIVVKPADKGNAVVIMSRNDYIWEGMRQLENTEHYRPLVEPIYPHTQIEVKEILEEMYENKIINSKQKEYLLGPGVPRARRFYLLPKIHKNSKGWSIPDKIPPGRPIVSDCNSETYNIAEFIEYHLNSISQKHNSYLKDTYDFIQKTQELRIPSDSLLFTIDIDSLYTNIETKAGLEAVRGCMRRYPDSKRPDEYLLKLLEINLTKNDFEFHSKYFLQIKGTAMGKRFAPSYANIFMAHWEETALATALLKPFSYFRFLDDIWGVWTYSKEDFIKFTEHLNQHERSIKIKFELDSERVNFLDVVTYKGPKFQQSNQLDYKVYFKETDTHCLLHRSSFHPRHTFKGILKSQLLRFHRICSQKEEFLKAVKILFKALKHRGYTRPFLRNVLREFKDYIEKPALPAQNTEEKIIPLVTFYSSQSTQLNWATKQNFTEFLKETSHLQNHKPIAAYKRNKNLLDILVQSKIQSLNTNMNPKAGSCKYYVHLRWVKNRTSKQIFQVDSNTSVETANCVYMIFCNKCKRQYVGQTKNELRKRIYQHTHNIINKIEKRRFIVRHFMSHGLPSLRATVLQANSLWDLKDRLKAERSWIKKLGTLYPRGLNEV